MSGIYQYCIDITNTSLRRVLQRESLKARSSTLVEIIVMFKYNYHATLTLYRNISIGSRGSWSIKSLIWALG